MEFITLRGLRICLPSFGSAGQEAGSAFIALNSQLLRCDIGFLVPFRVHFVVILFQNEIGPLEKNGSFLERDLFRTEETGPPSSSSLLHTTLAKAAKIA